MSTAELTARRVYREYNLGELSVDVKRQLMILFLTPNPLEEEEGNIIPAVPAEVLRSRAEKSYQQAINGEGKPIDELFAEMSSKYSWL